MQLNDNTKNRDQNNFDQLRFIAASLVIFSHSYPLALGDNNKEPFNLLTGGNATLGSLSVAIFFLISGYLITRSWNNQPKLKIFAWKRILRVYPGVASTILFSTFLIGPLASPLNIEDYLSNINILNLIKSIIFLNQYNVPSVFNNNIFPSAVNGSLWTLILEANMYLTTALFGLSGILKKKWPLIVFFILLIITCNSNINFKDIHYVGLFVNKVVVYYLIGMFYFLYKDKIKYDRRLLLLGLFIWLISLNTKYYESISYIFIPYLTFYCAFKPTKYLRRFVDKGDYSYGLYIYAFPIQQMIVHFFQNTITPIELFIIAYPLTLFIAFLSWNYVEKRALTLKDMNFSNIFSFTKNGYFD